MFDDGLMPGRQHLFDQLQVFFAIASPGINLQRRPLLRGHPRRGGDDGEGLRIRADNHRSAFVHSAPSLIKICKNPIYYTTNALRWLGAKRQDLRWKSFRPNFGKCACNIRFRAV